MPADKPKPSKSAKSRTYQRPPRQKNRFNQREVARAGRAGLEIGAERVEVDPETGKISIILPTGKSTTPPDDLLSKL
jgi:hypothetical protein